ncbi:MAG: dTDP-4-dehydrorhamnose 3,5-epimerase, partial [Vicinamibacteria bacterium]|nr:dTDP-4-dehydrorhamnose 3,5-epimerase [Vicinamibacteria bacterium]
SREHERTLLWNDPDLGIVWPGSDAEFVLSEKDRAGMRLKDCEQVFAF